MWTRQQIFESMGTGESQLPETIRNYYDVDPVEFNQNQRRAGLSPWAHARIRELFAGRTVEDTDDEPADVTDDDLLAQASSADHESCHLTIGKHYRGKMRRAEAFVGGGGVCEYSGLTPHQKAVMLVAGAEGTQVAMASVGCSADREQLIQALRDGGMVGSDDQLMDQEARLQAIALGILGEHWQFRRECTAALARKGVLTGDEIDELWELYG